MLLSLVIAERGECGGRRWGALLAEMAAYSLSLLLLIKGSYTVLCAVGAPFIDHYTGEKEF